MTLRDIVFALRYIDTRKHNNYAMQAALHGHKIKLKDATPQKKDQESEFTDEESVAAEKAMQKAMQRRQINAKFRT